MTYFDEDEGADLKAAFEGTVSHWSGVTATTMFGCPSYTADGTLFAVLVTDGVALTRLPVDERARLEAAFDTRPFEAGGRTVTKWVLIPVDDPSDLDPLVPYVTASYETALEESDG